MLHLHNPAGMTQPDFIAGMTEHEEGDQHEGAEHDAHDHKPLLVRKTVADASHFGREFTLGVCHTLLYTVSLAARRFENTFIVW